MNTLMRSTVLVLGVATGVILVLLLSPVAALAGPAGYGVTQTNNLLFVKTPWGSSLYIGPVGFDSIPSYEFEIPLSDFRASLAHAQGGTGNGDSGSQAASPSGDTSSLIAEANRLYNQGKFSRALEFVDEANRRDPQNVRVWIMKGSLMHVLGHEDLAKQAWQKALTLDPTNTQLQNILKEQK